MRIRGRVDVRAGAVTAFVAVCLGAAGIAAASGPGQTADLVPPVVSSLIPSPVASVVQGTAGGLTQGGDVLPSPVQNTVQTLTEILPSPLQSLLPDLTSVLPGSGGVPEGGMPDGSAGSSRPAGHVSPRSLPHQVHVNAPGSKDLPATVTGSVRLAPNGGAAGRAFRLAGPMSAPVAAALLALAGIAIFSRSRSAFQVLEQEKEAVGGWTVIRL